MCAWVQIQVYMQEMLGHLRICTHRAQLNNQYWMQNSHAIGCYTVLYLVKLCDAHKFHDFPYHTLGNAASSTMRFLGLWMHFLVVWLMVLLAQISQVFFLFYSDQYVVICVCSFLAWLHLVFVHSGRRNIYSYMHIISSSRWAFDTCLQQC